MVYLNSAVFLCSVGIIMIISLSILGFISINNSSGIGTDQKSVRAMLQGPSSSTGSLKLINHRLNKPFFSNWVVNGQLEKIDSLSERFSIINVIFLDKDGNILNSSSTKIENIKTGEIKDFKVEYHGSIDPASYKIELNTYS